MELLNKKIWTMCFCIACSSMMLAQNMGLKITHIEVKLLPCFFGYQELVDENNFDLIRIHRDTLIYDKSFCDEIKKIMWNSDSSKTTKRVVDPRIYLKCYYENNQHVILLTDYFGRYSINQKYYCASNELVEILCRDIPRIKQCVTRLKN